MRPKSMLINSTLYWTIRLYTEAGILVDADSTPTVAIRKNGSGVGDSVTVTKRSATTGIYDCSWNPASEAEGDQFTIEETAVISAATYSNSWGVVVFAVERGTDSALLASGYTAPLDAAGVRTAIGIASANLDTQIGDIPTVAEFEARTLPSSDYFDPATDTVARVTLVDTVTDLTNHIADSAIRNAIGLASANLDTQLSGISAPSAETVAGAVWDKAAASHTDSGSFGELVGGLSAATGSGARSITVTAEDADENPLESVGIRFVAAGVTYASGRTNSSGVLVVSLDDGTYQINAYKSGYSFTPESIVVTGEGAETITLSRITVDVTEPNQSVGYLTTFDGSGNIAPSVSLKFRLVQDDGTVGESSTSKEFTATSDADGLLQVPLIRGGTYRISRGIGRRVSVTVPDADSFELPEILGA